MSAFQSSWCFLEHPSLLPISCSQRPSRWQSCFPPQHVTPDIMGVDVSSGSLLTPISFTHGHCSRTHTHTRTPDSSLQTLRWKCGKLLNRMHTLTHSHTVYLPKADFPFLFQMLLKVSVFSFFFLFCGNGDLSFFWKRRWRVGTGIRSTFPKPQPHVSHTCAHTQTHIHSCIRAGRSCLCRSCFSIQSLYRFLLKVALCVCVCVFTQGLKTFFFLSKRWRCVDSQPTRNVCLFYA